MADIRALVRSSATSPRMHDHAALSPERMQAHNPSHSARASPRGYLLFPADHLAASIGGEDDAELGALNGAAAAFARREAAVNSGIFPL